MLVFHLSQNEEEFKRTLLQMLKEAENVQIGIEKRQGLINLFGDREVSQMVRLEEKIRELVKAIFWEKKGLIYKTVLWAIEKPLIEIVLEYTSGNKLKTAKLLGISRNTLELKIKRLKIETLKFKI